MRFTTLLYTLFGLVAMSIAVPSGVEPGVELLPKLRPKTERRQVSVIEGLQPREIGGGFVAVLPDDNAIPADSDGGSNSRRRFLRKDEVVVPESLQEPSSKRAVYYCRNSGYGICSGTNYCCPLGEPSYPQPIFLSQPWSIHVMNSIQSLNMLWKTF